MHCIESCQNLFRRKVVLAHNKGVNFICVKAGGGSICSSQRYTDCIHTWQRCSDRVLMLEATSRGSCRASTVIISIRRCVCVMRFAFLPACLDVADIIAFIITHALLQKAEYPGHGIGAARAGISCGIPDRHPGAATR